MTGLEMIQQMGERAREAASALALAGAEEKNGALAAIAAALGQNTGEILAANRADLDAARAGAVDLDELTEMLNTLYSEGEL